MKGKWILSIVVLFFPYSLPLTAQEQYPNKAITFIFSYAPGGGVDSSNKVLVEALKKDLNVPIIPKYVVGAAGALGAYEISKAKPDGYLIGNANLVPMALVPHTTGVKYRPMEDFDFIGTFVQMPVGYIVRADSSIKSLKDLIEAARRNPDQIKFGNSTPGGFMGLAAAYIERAEKIRFKAVPYPGGSNECMSALLGGHLDFMGNNPAGIKPYIKSGHIRMLVSTSWERHSDLSIPTLRELGYDFDQMAWGAVGAPKGLPTDIKKRLEAALNNAVKDSDFVRVMQNLDTPIDYHSGDDYKKMVTKYHNIFGDLVKEGYRY